MTTSPSEVSVKGCCSYCGKGLDNTISLVTDEGHFHDKCFTEFYYPQNNEVSSPSHYNNGAVECIDAIKASMTHEEYVGYLKGAVIKYLWRYRYKGKPLQDLQKAEWYLRRLIEEQQDD